jgi:hypothetical protein
MTLDRSLEWYVTRLEADKAYLAEKRKQLESAARNFHIAEKKVWKTKQQLTRKRNSVGQPIIKP